MSKKSVYVCVQRDIVNSLNWSLREFEKNLTVKYFDTTADLEKQFTAGHACSLLILDSIMAGKPTIELAQKYKQEHPHMKVLLILSSGTTREELVQLIQTKAVSGVLVRPFTALQVSDNIYKLCNFEKPSETPWYMQTNIKQP
jgi:DNA-binding NtrC family response regulator